MEMTLASVTTQNRKYQLNQRSGHSKWLSVNCGRGIIVSTSRNS